MSKWPLGVLKLAQKDSRDLEIHSEMVQNRNKISAKSNHSNNLFYETSNPVGEFTVGGGVVGIVV